MKYHAPFGSVDPDASYVDRNTPGAVVGSKVPAAALESPQRELAALIGFGGLIPADNDQTQVAKAIQSGKINFAVAGGSANAITATLLPAPSAVPVGMTMKVPIAATNTLTATLSTFGLGIKPITRPNGAPTAPGDLVAGTIATVVWTGTSWQLRSTARYPMSAQSVIFVSGNFIVPAFVFLIKHRIWGGGGGGGGGANAAGIFAGTGGGGGGYTEGYVAVTPGQTLVCTVGAGGSPGPIFSSGGVGGTSAIAGVAQATGGTGGNYQSAATTTESSGGGGSLGTINFTGQPGAIVVRDGSTGNAVGGAGGSAAGGGGGGGVASNAAPSIGRIPGGGGGGSGGPGGFNGGGGASGLIILEY